MVRHRSRSKQLRSMLDAELADLDRSIDEKADELGEASLGSQVLDEATRPQGEMSVRERQLAQFRESRGHGGYDNGS